MYALSPRMLMILTKNMCEYNEYMSNPLLYSKRHNTEVVGLINYASSKAAVIMLCSFSAQMSRILCCHSYERIGIRDASYLYSFLNIHSSREGMGDSNKCLYAIR